MEPSIEHLLSIKVNRIVSTESSVSHFVSEDEYNSLLTLEDNFETSTLPAEYATKWRFLPKSFSQIYLGETFTFYLCLTNDSVTDFVKDINMKIDLQVSSSNVMSLGYVNCDILDAKQSIDQIMHHEVKDLGVHVMICTIRYATKNEEQHTFRKYFRFQVYKPLDVKTKFYNAENDEVYLESLLQNLTSIPLCLEKVTLEPSEYFVVKDMNKIKNGEGDQWVFGEVNRFNPMESRQYLFCLTPKNELKTNINLLKSVTVIGKLDIIWTSAIGVKGHLQTSQLERMVGNQVKSRFNHFQRQPPNYNDIRLTVEEVPSQVPLKEKFNVVLRITNYCKQDMEPYLYFDNKTHEQSILWLGISGKCLEKLAPLSSTAFSLTGYPIKSGLHPIPSIRLTDILSKNHYDFSEIAYVFVNDSTRH